MGFVYYGAYATYFEVARVEALRSIGIAYKSMEKSGILMPVIQYAIKYFKPGLYDDVLSINTKITQLPSVKIRFDYQTFNENGDLLNEASTDLVFLSNKTMKPVRAPQILIESLSGFFT